MRYKDLPPAVFRSFGFPSVDDIGNMFQFKADFSDRYYANRSIEFSRSLNPELQTLDQWMAANKDRIPSAERASASAWLPAFECQISARGSMTAGRLRFCFQVLGGNIGVAQPTAAGRAAMRVADTNIFNMVSLRGAGGSAPIDPVLEASSSTVIPILRANKIDLQWPSIEDLDRLPDRAAFTLAELSSLRLAKLADAFQERAPLDAEALDAISHSPDGLDDPAVIVEEYDRLTDSWLIARLKRDQPAIAAHERLIKAARLWKQY